MWVKVKTSYNLLLNLHYEVNYILWKYCESSIKMIIMIIFKFILAEFKQNLRWGWVQIFILGESKQFLFLFFKLYIYIYIYIYKLPGQWPARNAAPGYIFLGACLNMFVENNCRYKSITIDAVYSRLRKVFTKILFPSDVKYMVQFESWLFSWRRRDDIIEL